MVKKLEHPESGFRYPPGAARKNAVVVSGGVEGFQKVAEATGIGKLATQTMRHTYRASAARTPIAVRQKLMWHGDIRTTMNIYDENVGDVRKGCADGSAQESSERQVKWPLSY